MQVSSMIPLFFTMMAIVTAECSSEECPSEAQPIGAFSAVQIEKTAVTKKLEQPVDTPFNRFRQGNPFKASQSNYWDESRTVMHYYDGNRQGYIAENDVPISPELTYNKFEALRTWCTPIIYLQRKSATAKQDPGLTLKMIRECMANVCQRGRDLKRTATYEYTDFTNDVEQVYVTDSLEWMEEKERDTFKDAVEALGFTYNKGFEKSGESACGDFTMEVPCEVKGLVAEGAPCYENNECCSGFCLNAQDTVAGTCEVKEQTLYKCLWLYNGVEYAENQLNCPMDGFGPEGCPRIGDPVKVTQWTPFSKLGREDLKEYEADGYIECGQFVTKCTWTELGVEIFNDMMRWGRDAPLPVGEDASIADDFAREFTGRYPRLWDPALAETLGASYLLADLDCKDFDKAGKMKEEDRKEGNGGKGAPGNSKFCARIGEPVTTLQAELTGLGPKMAWEIYVDKGAMQCLTDREAYAAWALRRNRAERVLCHGLNYNCFTREAAEEACRQWSADPAVPGSGSAELCFKHELGETVGRNCRYMWTADSVGKEGCYESNGVNWADTVTGVTVENISGHDAAAKAYNEQIDHGLDVFDVGCRAAAGIVHCTKLVETNYDMHGKDNHASTVEVFPLDTKFQRGFDAACCDRHNSGPYRHYNYNNGYEPDRKGSI